MLGRKTFTPGEVATARANVATQLETWRRTGSADVDAEATYFNAMLLALDRIFVHRTRKVTGKATTPLNEAEVLVDALTLNDGEVRGVSGIDYDPEETVLGLAVGDRVRLDGGRFEKLAEAFLAEIEEKYCA